jgi:hypothetical protein
MPSQSNSTRSKLNANVAQKGNRSRTSVVAGSTQLGKRTPGGENLDGVNTSKRKKAATATGSSLFTVSEKPMESRRLPKKKPQRNHPPASQSPAGSQNTRQESTQPDQGVIAALPVPRASGRSVYSSGDMVLSGLLIATQRSVEKCLLTENPWPDDHVLDPVKPALPLLLK